MCILSRSYGLIKLASCIFTSFSGNEHLMDRFKATSIIFLFSAIAAMTGCNSEEDSAPAMPDHARIIDLSNAKSTYDEALSATDTIFEKDSETTLTINDIYCNTGSAIVDIDIDENDQGEDEQGDGTIVVPVNVSGAVTFYECVTDDYVELNGIAVFNTSLIVTDYGDIRSNYLSAGISITPLNTGLETQLNEIEILEETNIDTGAYVIKVYQYAYDSGNDGFTVQLANEISGSNYSCGPASGVIIINGGGGTRLRATYNSNSSLTLEVNIDNGVYTLVPGSPFHCGI